MCFTWVISLLGGANGSSFTLNSYENNIYFHYKPFTIWMLQQRVNFPFAIYSEMTQKCIVFARPSTSLPIVREIIHVKKVKTVYI